MGKFYHELNEALKQFIMEQQMFFNASAPNQGRVNVSPKGLDSLRILNDRCVAYLDLTGGENETAAHIAENGRLTLMFCSYKDKPMVLRLYGKGRVILPRHPEWKEMRRRFQPLPGDRQIIVLDIESILSTCGFGVPLYEYQGQRKEILEFALKMGKNKMDAYRRLHNEKSIDGLPTHLFENPSDSKRK